VFIGAENTWNACAERFNEIQPVEYLRQFFISRYRYAGKHQIPEPV
jgi:hypothetical protein